MSRDRQRLEKHPEGFGLGIGSALPCRTAGKCVSMYRSVFANEGRSLDSAGVQGILERSGWKGMGSQIRMRDRNKSIDESLQ